MTSGRDDTIILRGTMPVEDAKGVMEATELGQTVKLRAQFELTEEDQQLIKSILDAPEDRDFVDLLKMTGMDPATDLRYSDASGANWGALDLDGYDLTGANLTGCDFSGCKVEGLIYTGAKIDDVKWPDGFTPVA